MDYIGVEDERLIFFASPGNPDTAMKVIQVPPQLLRSRSRFSIRTDLQDCQVYVFNRQAVLEALEARSGVLAIKRDLLPLLAAMGLQEERRVAGRKGAFPFAVECFALEDAQRRC